MSVYAKLNEARLKFHQLQLKKTGHNKFAGYNYFELGDFLIPALGVFNEVGLCAIVSFTADTASLRIIDLDTATETTITSPMGSAALKGCHEVQNIGAVETYQRRYLWVAAMEIVEHDALEATTGKHEPEVRQAPAKKTISATDGALDNLGKQERLRAERLAVAISSAFAAGEDWGGFETYEGEADQEVRIGIWSLLQSNVRSKLKHMKTEANKPVTEGAYS